ncbi:Rhodanese-like domain-containing protein 6 [Symbiodinium microadriaticum]|uniref:Rhodanese-like domain-containing protein 6 n=1 Tax=Symbiodinium microadriaticum TaxID=2951 RepID=A0A1Q9D2J8_SYMMI|nr:Rhodanese-like domain-containing protein 6 [Symbiodinium microadriaticum]
MSLSTAVTDTAETVQAPQESAVTDQVEFDANQNALTQAIERAIWEMLGVSDEFLELYYSQRKNVPIQGVCIRGGHKGPEDISRATHPGQQRTAIRLDPQYGVNRVLVCVLVYKGDDVFERSVAKEGVNGWITGAFSDVETYCAHLRTDLGDVFGSTDFKISPCSEQELSRGVKAKHLKGVLEKRRMEAQANGSLLDSEKTSARKVEAWQNKLRQEDAKRIGTQTRKQEFWDMAGQKKTRDHFEKMLAGKTVWLGREVQNLRQACLNFGAHAVTSELSAANVFLVDSLNPEKKAQWAATLQGGTLISQTVLEPQARAPHLSPQEWHEKLARGGEDLVLFDVRNFYETRIGHFDAPGDQGRPIPRIDPRTLSYEQVPEFLAEEENLSHFQGKTVMMYCTGGVRCERASTLLRSALGEQSQVFQLQGGIHRYLESYPTGGFFQGSMYVFDRRRFVRGPDLLSSEASASV